MVLKKDDLINWFEEGCKPKELFRIGTEHEKFVYKMDSLKPVSYEEESGIRNIFLANCWVSVLPPCFILPARTFVINALNSAFMSNPLCSKKRLSSVAIIA